MRPSETWGLACNSWVENGTALFSVFVRRGDGRHKYSCGRHSFEGAVTLGPALIGEKEKVSLGQKIQVTDNQVTGHTEYDSHSPLHGWLFTLLIPLKTSLELGRWFSE